MYLAVVFALLLAWLIHWEVGLALLLILAPPVLWRFRRYWKEAGRAEPDAGSNPQRAWRTAATRTGRRARLRVSEPWRLTAY
jgi:cytochrome b561